MGFDGISDIFLANWALFTSGVQAGYPARAGRVRQKYFSEKSSLANLQFPGFKGHFLPIKHRSRSFHDTQDQVCKVFNMSNLDFQSVIKPESFWKCLLWDVFFEWGDFAQTN